MLSEDLGAGLVLARSSSATHALSPNRNRNRIYWKSAAMMPRKLAEMARSGVPEFLDAHRAGQDLLSVYSNRLFVLPTSGELVPLLWRWLIRYLRLGLLSKFYWAQWQLRFGFRDDVLGAPWRFKKVVPPGDRFWADPHVIRRDGRYYVFIEENPNDTHGHIAVMEIREDGSCTTPTPVLKEPFHLSLPLPLRVGGRTLHDPRIGWAPSGPGLQV